jgi:hypothetical protein
MDFAGALGCDRAKVLLAQSDARGPRIRMGVLHRQSAPRRSVWAVSVCRPCASPLPVNALFCPACWTQSKVAGFVGGVRKTSGSESRDLAVGDPP